MANNRNLSFWWDTLPQNLVAANRPSLNGDINVDVAIVGAGYSGLWTAYYLLQRDPSLEIAIVDANVAGFGASGRNGGWCSALFPTSIDKLGRLHGSQSARDMQDAMHGTVSEIEEIVAQNNLDCDWQRGGTLVFARSELQKDRALAEISNWQSWGYGSDDYSFLSAEEVAGRSGVTNNFGATYTKHTAAVHPAKLVRNLALIVENYGATIYENTPAVEISEGKVTTHFGTIRSKYVVRATEGYTPSLKSLKREIAPIYSLMLATEPLSDEVWEQIGLANRETFSDGRNLIIYGQRTVDNRIAFGGRGAPYHFGSRVSPEFDRNQSVHSELVKILAELFPVLNGVSISHYWGGPLGIARDWMASCGLDKQTKIAWAGGYVGDGVGTSNLAGRTLADLITGKDTPLIKLPWVNHRSPRWEIEPLRWLGANAGLQAMTFADLSENKTGKPSRIPDIVGKLTGA